MSLYMPWGLYSYPRFGIKYDMKAESGVSFQKRVTEGEVVLEARK